MEFVDKDLISIQEARILAESARDAQCLLREYDQKTIDRMLDQLLGEVKQQLPELIAYEVAETKRGNEKDKLQLWQSFLGQLSEALEEQTIGSLKTEGSLKHIGVPLGVIAVILPAENILLNALFATVSALKSGNSVILIPAGKTEAIASKLFDIFQPVKAGFPQSSVCLMENTALEGIEAMMKHESVALVINIGSPAYFNLKTAAKPMIYGSSGSTPVFIERTADIQQAAEEIISSRAFDNGLLPSAEQFVIAESMIASEVKMQMMQAGAHFMSGEEERQLLSKLYLGSEINPAFVGREAKVLADLAGFTVAEQTRVLVSEQPYIFDENPFATALQCPILTFYLESDWIHACDKCIQLLKEKQNGHTLAIHSKDQAIIREFALKKPVGRMLVNTGTSLAGIGLDSTLPVSLILGGLTTGRGFKAESITARDLRYVREIGYKKGETFNGQKVKDDPILDEQALLEKFLKKIMEQ